MTTKTTLHSLWTKQINLPDGHRLFAASGNVYIGALPSEVAADERGIWAMADESGTYPHDTDDGVLWLDFRRPLDAGASKTEHYDGATPTIPLLNPGGHQCSTITDTLTLLALSCRFQWDINCLGTRVRGIKI
jgi:hypothetical protein